MKKTLVTSLVGFLLVRHPSADGWRGKRGANWYAVSQSTDGRRVKPGGRQLAQDPRRLKSKVYLWYPRTSATPGTGQDHAQSVLTDSRRHFSLPDTTLCDVGLRSLHRSHWAIPAIILCISAMLFCMTGCGRKPEGSTGKTADLYSALHDVVLLNRQYKAGKISKQVFDAKAAMLDGKITDEFNKHRDDVWAYSLNILSNTPVAKTTQEQLNRMKPVARWQARDEWNGKLEPLAAMYAMLPMQMTMTVVRPGLTVSELNNIKYAFRPVELVYRDDSNCTTVFQFGYKIIAADFTREAYRWKPMEIRVYFRQKGPPLTGSPKKRSQTAIKQLPSAQS